MASSFLFYLASLQQVLLASALFLCKEVSFALAAMAEVVVERPADDLLLGLLIRLPKELSMCGATS